MKKEDEGIRAVRDVRKAISEKFNNDPERLIKHYIAIQEHHRDRLLRPVAAQQGNAPADASRRK